MIDLHLHLDGSLPLDTIRRLADRQEIPLPDDDGELKRLVCAPADCQSLNEYLTCFELPKRLMQTGWALSFAAEELVCLLAKQGLLYAEIRFAPQLHTEQGLNQRKAVEAACRGVEAGLRKTPGFEAQVILCCMRGAPEQVNRETIDLTKEFLGKGVCAADLAGAEAVYPTEDYRSLFAYAASLSVPYTIHAGEAADAQSVRDALQMGASRIGHGVHSIADEALLDELAERKIPLELCPTSNLQTKAVLRLRDYPLRAFLQRGVRATVNTDNMTVSQTTLKQEYARLKQEISLTEEEQRQLYIYAVEAAFLPPEKKECLRSRLNKMEVRRLC